MRLLDADELREDVDRTLNWNTNNEYNMYSDIMDMIDEAPTVEAEPIIRCKDCKYWSEPNMFDSYCRKMSITDNIIYTEPNHYCGFAER